MGEEEKRRVEKRREKKRIEEVDKGEHRKIWTEVSTCYT
jgi:hypothetical protein